MHNDEFSVYMLKCSLKSTKSQKMQFLSKNDSINIISKIVAKVSNPLRSFKVSLIFCELLG